MMSMRLIWKHLFIVDQLGSKSETVPVIKHEHLDEMHPFMLARTTIKLLQTSNHNINMHIYIQHIYA